MTDKEKSLYLPRPSNSLDTNKESKISNSTRTLANHSREPNMAQNEMHKLRDNSFFAFKRGFDGFDEEHSYLIKSYIPTNSLGVIFGATGSFKSFHVLSWVAHIALGKSWNDCNVIQAPVLYIAGEGGLGVPRRIKAIADKYNNSSDIEELIRLDHAIDMGNIKELNQLLDSIAKLQEHLKNKLGLVVIDTLARCFGSGDENRTDDMNRFIQACDRIRANLGVTVLVVHHSGIADKHRARGSTALKAACDFEYMIERVEGESPAYTLTCTKSKDDKENPKQIFSLAELPLFVDSEGEEVNSLVSNNMGVVLSTEETTNSNKSSNSQKVYNIAKRLLQNQPQITVSALLEETKKEIDNCHHFSRWITSCVNNGWLIKRNGIIELTN